MLQGTVTIQESALQHARWWFYVTDFAYCKAHFLAWFSCPGTGVSFHAVQTSSLAGWQHFTKRLRGCTTRQIPGGHFATVQQPKQVADAVDACTSCIFGTST